MIRNLGSHNPYRPFGERRQRPLLALFCRANRAEQCPSLSGGEFNRSVQHLLILLDKEVADGDVTDIVHGEAEG